ncbi:unnamed protein product [Rotaria magnacalcarata]|uniref:Uncharacterized protein n=1 Tax=Rotaria magnacalcarata TaxID=392030 RepID=A0A819SI03_9BILA|nr:unnamed protein product [Rotaria magnacalcarata]CAF4064898.1 unnamed protein product [Rotaria magnacalcarata]
MLKFVNPNTGTINIYVKKKSAENELLPLQEIAEQEMRKALLTAEAAAVLPGVSTIDNDINSLALLLFIFVSDHNLIHHRHKVIPKAPESSAFVIPDLYCYDRSVPLRS